MPSPPLLPHGHPEPARDLVARTCPVMDAATRFLVPRNDGVGQRCRPALVPDTLWEGQTGEVQIRKRIEELLAEAP